jgi:hypothetical protein
MEGMELPVDVRSDEEVRASLPAKHRQMCAIHTSLLADVAEQDRRETWTAYGAKSEEALLINELGVGWRSAGDWVGQHGVRGRPGSPPQDAVRPREVEKRRKPSNGRPGSVPLLSWDFVLNACRRCASSAPLTCTDNAEVRGSNARSPTLLFPLVRRCVARLVRVLRGGLPGHPSRVYRAGWV